VVLRHRTKQLFLVRKKQLFLVVVLLPELESERARAALHQHRHSRRSMLEVAFLVRVLLLSVLERALRRSPPSWALSSPAGAPASLLGVWG